VEQTPAVSRCRPTLEVEPVLAPTGPTLGRAWTRIVPNLQLVVNAKDCSGLSAMRYRGRLEESHRRYRHRRINQRLAIKFHEVCTQHTFLRLGHVSRPSAQRPQTVDGVHEEQDKYNMSYVGQEKKTLRVQEVSPHGRQRVEIWE